MQHHLQSNYHPGRDYDPFATLVWIRDFIMYHTLTLSIELKFGELGGHPGFLIPIFTLSASVYQQ